MAAWHPKKLKNMLKENIGNKATLSYIALYCHGSHSVIAMVA